MVVKINGRDMKEEELSDWMIRYCKQELSEQEFRELEQWLNETERHRELFNQLLAAYKRGRRIGCWKTVNEERAWKQISRQLSSSPKPVRKLGKGVWKYVAAVVILIGTLSLYSTLQDISVDQNLSLSQIMPGKEKAILRLSDGREIALNRDTTCILTEKNGTQITVGGREHIVYQEGLKEQEKLIYNTILVPRGGEYSLILSDGTQIWLNAETELTYPIVFGKEERKLILKGEAYFDVARDTFRPFVVESSYNRVEVLGTKFNVSAYEKAASIKTTLLKGRVRVSNGSGHLLLEPGQQAVCQQEGIEKQEVDAGAVIAWVQGTFEFENMSLGEISEQLGRWYDVGFVFENPALKDITFTGAATRYRELGFMLHMLEQLSNVRFQVKDKWIQVSEK